MNNELTCTSTLRNLNNSTSQNNHTLENLNNARFNSSINEINSDSESESELSVSIQNIIANVNRDAENDFIYTQIEEFKENSSDVAAKIKESNNHPINSSSRNTASKNLFKPPKHKTTASRNLLKSNHKK
jgi:hypothetical protein